MRFLINQHVTAGTKFNSYLSKSPAWLGRYAMVVLRALKKPLSHTHKHTIAFNMDYMTEIFSSQSDTCFVAMQLVGITAYLDRKLHTQKVTPYGVQSKLIIYISHTALETYLRLIPTEHTILQLTSVGHSFRKCLITVYEQLIHVIMFSSREKHAVRYKPIHNPVHPQ